MSTGLNLPRGASICTDRYGSRELGRQASWKICSSSSHKKDKLQHTLEKVLVKKIARFKCVVCGRSGNWGERSRFLKFSCAGYTETPEQAVRRHRLEQSAKKCQNAKPLPAATLAEKALVISDMFSSMARHAKCFHGERTLTCRALAPLSLPIGVRDSLVVLFCFSKNRLRPSFVKLHKLCPAKFLSLMMLQTPSSLHGVPTILPIPLTSLGPFGDLLRLWIEVSCIGGQGVPRLTLVHSETIFLFENELGVQAPVGFWDPAGSGTSIPNCLEHISQAIGSSVMRRCALCVYHEMQKVSFDLHQCVSLTFYLMLLCMTMLFCHILDWFSPMHFLIYLILLLSSESCSPWTTSCRSRKILRRCRFVGRRRFPQHRRVRCYDRSCYRYSWWTHRCIRCCIPSPFVLHCLVA